MGTWFNRCEECPGEPPEATPAWRIDRYGDAAVTWACDAHLGKVMRRFIRPERIDNKFTLTYIES